MEAGIGLDPRIVNLTGRLVDTLVTGLGPEQRCDDLAVRVQHQRWETVHTGIGLGDQGHWHQGGRRPTVGV